MSDDSKMDKLKTWWTYEGRIPSAVLGGIFIGLTSPGRVPEVYLGMFFALFFTALSFIYWKEEPDGKKQVR